LRLSTGASLAGTNQSWLQATHFAGRPAAWVDASMGVAEGVPQRSHTRGDTPSGVTFEDGVVNVRVVTARTLPIVTQ
jgi:hypothetical protein